MHPRSAALRVVPGLLSLLLAACVTFPRTAGAQDSPGSSSSHALTFSLDRLMTFPTLWEKTPDTLTESLTDPGFTTSPYFRWAGRTEGSKDAAVFDKTPFSNVTVALSALEGKVPVESAAVQFSGGKASRLVVNLCLPGGQANQSEGDFNAAFTAAEAYLAKTVGGSPVIQARLRGFKGEQGLHTKVWKSSGAAIASIDYSKEKKVLRFTLASPSTDTDVLVAQPVRALISPEPSFFLDLDELLKFPGLWELTPQKVEAMFSMPGSSESPFYQWLTQDKSGVRFSRRPYSNVTVDLDVFDGAVVADEAVLEFTNGKATKLSISLYNRGDGGSIAGDEFARRYKQAGLSVGKLLNVRPTERRPGTQTAVKISGWAWNAPTALAALEYNSGALEGAAPEFLRLRFASPSQREAFASETGQTIRKTGLGKSELPRFVKRDPGGDVYVSGVPMVDQGDKGYCVVASCQRLFSYLRIPCDQHEIAQIAGTDAGTGTGAQDMEDALRKIDSRFKVNFKPLGYRLTSGRLGVPYGNRMTEVPFTKFQKQVEDYTGKGIPLLWALELGRFPEVPANAAQAGGGHMRLILGCNTGKDELIFTDSWGAGHEMKRMKLSDAYRATLALYVIEPKEY